MLCRKRDLREVICTFLILCLVYCFLGYVAACRAVFFCIVVTCSVVVVCLVCHAPSFLPAISPVGHAGLVWYLDGGGAKLAPAVRQLLEGHLERVGVRESLHVGRDFVLELARGAVVARAQIVARAHVRVLGAEVVR